MTPRTIMGLSLSALMLGGTMVGCAGSGGRLASASTRSDRAAAEKAVRAEQLLAKGRAAEAVAWAEGAVALADRTPRYRVLLGQSYLRTGRFVSAGQAFADVLTLTPGDGRAALNLALAQVGQGRWDAARATLAQHRAGIAAADYGLALALAGDPQQAVEILAEAVRGAGADAKARQNLALAHALAGNWQAAKSVAEVDLGEAEADRRIIEWAAFARPAAAGDQVAALLGVTPTVDGGQPVALALAASVPVAAAATSAVVPPLTVATIPVAPEPVVAAAPVAVAVAPVAAPAANVAAMAAAAKPAAPILAVPATIRMPGAFKTALTHPAAAQVPQRGTFFVQLGAFENAAVARDAWRRVSRKHAMLRGQTPQGTQFASAKGEFYRLSVGGYGRGDADRLCRSIRAGGGACFVRVGAGDQLAAWLRPTATRLAAAPRRAASRG